MNAPELRDIHLPDASLWWPLAPGWWMLMLIILLLCLALPRWMRFRRQMPLRKISLRQLSQLKHEYENGMTDRLVLERISRLIRRVMISYHGRKGYSASTGESWLTQLRDLSESQRFDRTQLEILVNQRYQREPDCDIEALLQACENWIRSLPRGRHVSD